MNAAGLYESRVVRPCVTCRYCCHPPGTLWCARIDRAPTQPDKGCEFYRDPKEQDLRPLRLLVCGREDDNHREHIWAALDRAAAHRVIETIIHWGGPGVPAMADLWCRTRRVDCTAFPLQDTDKERHIMAAMMMRATRPGAALVFPGRSWRTEAVLSIGGSHLKAWRPYGA